MNDGKICVSVCAETADEFIENIKRAAEFADVIELRFDCLNKNEIDIFYQKLDSHWKVSDETPLIVTFRTKEQGGFRELTQEERDVFWNSGYEIGWADCEEDIFEDSWFWLWDKRICSFHDFKGVSEKLPQIYERLKATEADVLKIAVEAGDVADSVAVWNLLERAKKDDQEIIPIAMGEPGKWTRILGLAHGAFMTYAALEAGKETADGQITAKDLVETYRVKELDKNTEIYGIIGHPVSHSLSPFIHNAAFRHHNLNAVFVPFDVKDLDKFVKKFLKEVRLNFKGFSVTIPHKQAIIEYLDELDETAKAIGAVNTVKIENGKLIGYNTDAAGFIEPLKPAYGDLANAKVAVIGAGGAARACVYALKNEDADVTVFARNLKKAENLAEEFQIELKELPKTDFANFDIVINATPLGTKGALENESILTAEQLEGVKLVYDLVYNPPETDLMREAEKANARAIGGLEMLIAQAAAQQKIWTGKTAPIEKMRHAALLKLA